MLSPTGRPDVIAFEHYNDRNVQLMWVYTTDKHATVLLDKSKARENLKFQDN